MGLFGGRAARGHLGHLGLHGLGHGGHRGGAHRRQQVLSVGEMAVGGIGCHTCAARGLAQYHGIGPALAGQLDAGVQQGAAQVSMAVGTAR